MKNIEKYRNQVTSVLVIVGSELVGNGVMSFSFDIEITLSPSSHKNIFGDH